MSILNQLACALGERSEVPNQILARRLAESEDRTGITELVIALHHKDRNIQSDSLKVLYEIGYLKPQLIAPYAGDFLALLKSRNNRLVWGGMIALGTISRLAADALFPHIERIKKAITAGSVITVDWGVRALAGIASAREEYNAAIFPSLLEHLLTCRPKDIAHHAEEVLPAVTIANRGEYIRLLQIRMADLSTAQVTRIRRCIAKAEELITPGSSNPPRHPDRGVVFNLNNGIL